MGVHNEFSSCHINCIIVLLFHIRLFRALNLNTFKACGMGVGILSRVRAASPLCATHTGGRLFLGPCFSTTSVSSSEKRGAVLFTCGTAVVKVCTRVVSLTMRSSE